MKEEIEKNVASLVDLVIDLAALMSESSEKDEPIKDLIQAKAVFEKAVSEIDRSKPWKTSAEMEFDTLFRNIPNLLGDRFRNDEETIGALCWAYLSVGHLTARLLRKGELSAHGKLGARKRYAPMRELEAWVLSEYRRGNWKSANQAAHALKDVAVVHGRTLGANLTESNAQRTIAEWINKDKKAV